MSNLTAVDWTLHISHNGTSTPSTTRSSTSTAHRHGPSPSPRRSPTGPLWASNVCGHDAHYREAEPVCFGAGRGMAEGPYPPPTAGRPLSRCTSPTTAFTTGPPTPTAGAGRHRTAPPGSSNVTCAPSRPRTAAGHPEPSPTPCTSSPPPSSTTNPSGSAEHASS